MRWTNRQYIDLMTYNNPERPMFCELFGPLVGLPEEWRRQGATEEMISLEAFSFDYVDFFKLGHFGAIHCHKTIVLEEDEFHYVGIDYLGRKVKMDKRTASIPHPLTYPVETMDDWLKIKHMFVYDDCRISDDWINKAKELQKSGAVIRAAICGGFDILRELMGEENCCIAYYEDPELVWDILNTISEMNERVLSKITKHIAVDLLSVHEDLAGKTGPLVGPNIVNEFMVPYYRKAWDIARDAGTKLFSQDSDGNINVNMDAFIAGGINIFSPCEPAANMDIVELRKKYGHKIAFHGGIDKHILRRTKEEIKAEVDYKLQNCMMDGGVAFGLDHRIPNGTPLKNYIYYVDYVREKLGLEDFRKCKPSWSRMAV